MESLKYKCNNIENIRSILEECNNKIPFITNLFNQEIESSKTERELQNIKYKAYINNNNNYEEERKIQNEINKKQEIKKNLIASGYK